MASDDDATRPDSGRSEAPYRTIGTPCEFETDKVKGSRFIGRVDAFRSEAELQAMIERQRARFSEANHHCWAWRSGDRFRYSDDGEPSGSAGRPILQQIDGREVDRVQVVVTRIFGGTKLGVGGLVRAYGGAAGAVLDRADVIEVIPTTRLRLSFGYSLSPIVQSVLNAAELQPVESDFGEAVSQVLEVPHPCVSELVAELNERTSGRIDIDEESDREDD